MKIRFLQTTQSDRPEYPFQAGQIIEVSSLTRTMKAWLTDGAAYLLHDEPEAAVVGASERAVLPRPRARGKR